LWSHEAWLSLDLEDELRVLPVIVERMICLEL
jgi:hypothetical protein